MQRQAIVFGQVTRLGALGAQLDRESASSFFSDVFVQSARRVTGLDDALDGFEREGAEACGMTECLVDGVGSVALS